MTHTRSWQRLLVVLVAAVAALVPLAGPAHRADAADLATFQPGNIISDAVFFDSLSMDATQVQSFLDAKGSNCSTASDGTACLKDYRLSTPARAADSYCQSYPAGTNERASVVIVRVGVACGVSPRVLLVLLQKEQGLVTATTPSSRKYIAATGFGCPDTSACNPAYAGLANQLYYAARQYQRYAAGDAGSYRAGRTQNILYNPSSSCGSTAVYIQNVATAGLYNYTPYVPNAAALAAGYGSGDSCSAYGNRNFFSYFTDWFGSTQSPGAGAILSAYKSQGGSTGNLGPEVTGYVCGLTANGCFQRYATGAIYWTQATGAHIVSGQLLDSWGPLRYEAGTLGYPLTDSFCGLVASGCFQDFQGGSLYWSPASGGHFTRGLIRQAWGGTGWENGPLSYPVSDEMCGLRVSGCFQSFQNGTIYWSPLTGAYAVTGALYDKWAQLKWETGTLGYPTNAAFCGLAGGGCFQEFQGGSLYSGASSGAHFTRGLIRQAWGATGWESGTLGYPTSDEMCGLRSSGCFQQFQNGSIYWSPSTGAYPVLGQVYGRWAQLGWEAGAMGYPTAAARCDSDGACSQTFQNGSLVGTSSGSPFILRGLIKSSWDGAGGRAGAVGEPITDEMCGLRSSGCFQQFVSASIYWTPVTGAHIVSGPIRDAWGQNGWETGGLGYPEADASTSGTRTQQQFQGGTLTWDSATGTVTRS